MCDFDIIQLLPVNDTGAEASPYSARSAFALNPVFINIQAVQGSGEFENEIEEAKTEFDHQARIDYYKISTWKRTILRHIFDNRYDQIKKDKELAKWIDNNSWAKAYCAYSVLKAQNNESSWKDWKNSANPPKTISKSSGPSTTRTCFIRPGCSSSQNCSSPPP